MSRSRGEHRILSALAAALTLSTATISRASSYENTAKSISDYSAASSHTSLNNPGRVFAFTDEGVFAQAVVSMDKLNFSGSHSAPGAQSSIEQMPLVVTGKLPNLSLNFWLYIPNANPASVEKVLKETFQATEVKLTPLNTGAKTLITLNNGEQLLYGQGCGLISFSESNRDNHTNCACEHEGELSQIFARAFAAGLKVAASFGPARSAASLERY